MYLSVSEVECGVLELLHRCLFPQEWMVVHVLDVSLQEPQIFSCGCEECSCMLALLKCRSNESLLQELPCAVIAQGKLEQENPQRLAGDACPHGLTCVRHLHGCSSCSTNTTNASFPLVTEIHCHRSQDDSQNLTMLMAWQVYIFKASFFFFSLIAADVFRCTELSHQRISRLQSLPGARLPRPGPSRDPAHRPDAGDREPRCPGSCRCCRCCPKANEDRQAGGRS